MNINQKIPSISYIRGNKINLPKVIVNQPLIKILKKKKKVFFNNVTNFLVMRMHGKKDFVVEKARLKHRLHKSRV